MLSSCWICNLVKTVVSFHFVM